jgi:multiple antibiotic resistance protein
VAGAVILAFAVGGQQVLHLLGISLEALQVAGGLLLLVIALELLHPSGGDGTSSLTSGDTNIALVPLGTPLLAGPGAIAATMLYTRQADDVGGSISVVLALVAVLGVIYLSMRYASVFARVLRDNGIELLSRVMGLLVAAIAVQLVARAVEAWVTNGVA